MRRSEGSNLGRGKGVACKVHILLASLLLAVFALAGTATAVRLQKGTTVLKFDTRISPRRLPRTLPAPASIRVSARVSTTDGSVPPALNKLLVKVDRDISFGTVGLSVCKAGQIMAKDNKSALRVCRRALVGTGSMGIEITFPGVPPLFSRARSLVFNAGTRHHTTTLLIHSFLTMPAPAAVVTTIRLRPIRGGAYGLLATATMPRVAGGAGAITSFKLKLGRRYAFRGRRMSVFSGVCSHHRLGIQVTGVFSGGVVARGRLVHGCASR